MISPRSRPRRPGPSSCSPPELAAQAEALRGAVQQFVRTFGLLSGDQTPCGEPLATSHAHALMILLPRAGARPAVMQQELASALGIDKSNIARLCAKMERAGHVAQQRSPTDGRARLVELTARGRRLAEQVDAASRARFAAVLAAVPEACRPTLLDALDVLNDAAARVAPLASKPEDPA
jgi:DNA-binding MarR family transcriptional regulator